MPQNSWLILCYWAETPPTYKHFTIFKSCWEGGAGGAIVAPHSSRGLTKIHLETQACSIVKGGPLFEHLFHAPVEPLEPGCNAPESLSVTLCYSPTWREYLWSIKHNSLNILIRFWYYLLVYNICTCTSISDRHYAGIHKDTCTWYI